MAERPILSVEEFTIRQPLFFAGILAFAWGTVGGLFLDLHHKAMIAVTFDCITGVVLLAVIAGVRFWKLSRSRAVAALIYTGALNFLFSIAQALIDRPTMLDTSIYNNLFILTLFLAVSTFLVGRSSSIVFGVVILGVLLAASTLWRNDWITGNLWFEIPAVLGTTFLLYQYRGSLDHLLNDLQKAVRENKALRDRERLAALGEMTAGIAHEIKNPLNFVVNFAESSQELLNDLDTLLAKPQLTEEEAEERNYLFRELRQNLEDIRAQGLRGASTVQGMLLQARSGGEEFQALDLNELAGECLQLAWLGRRETLARRRFLPGPFPVVVKGSRADLSRAFLNLCTNALWSVLERARREGSDYFPEVSVSVSAMGSEAHVIVRDNGLGLSEQTKAQLFVPFFTTKGAGEGTGLGLVLTREVVVDQHSGRIEVEGALGAGAQFTVVLPLLGGTS